MKIEEYQDIVNIIRKHRGLTKTCAQNLVEKYNSYHSCTLYSILSQEIVEKMKRTHHQVFGKHEQYYKSYTDSLKKKEPPGILLRLSYQLNTCPALLARKILEDHYKGDNETDSKKRINQMFKDTTLIDDRNLAYEIYMCILFDDQYGPIASTMCDSVGEEYEGKLENYLIERNIPYSNEEYLRTKGYDKTPDCKLEVPIAVNGFVINWIESKAQFGSPLVHKKYVKNQFLSYWNRFGPGLVIYWFGFLDNITPTSETKFIIMDHFPENITYMFSTSSEQL